MLSGEDACSLGFSTLFFWSVAFQKYVCAGGSSVFIRSGDDMVLSCQHVISGQINCNGTTWLYSNPRGSVELVTLGQVKNVQSKSNRLSVAAKCSLVMRNITVKDAGYYECQQYKSEAEPSKHILVHHSGVSLSVVHMSEQKVTDVVTLTCSVETRGQCGYRVKWLTDCSTGNIALINCTTQHSGCSAAVCFIEDSYTQRCEVQCEVTDGETKQIFNFNHQSTEDKSGKTSCNPTRKPFDTTTSDPATKPTNVLLSNEAPSGAPYIAAAVVLVALLTVAGIVIRWRTKRNVKQVHVYAEVNPTVPVSTTNQETSRDNVEDEDGVYYSTISETPVRFNVVGERDDMTYSTVGAPGPPAAAFTDPNGLYSLLTAPGK
ncbi:uncharacterized protein LOC111611382 isoform X1 [Xiphophorus maculatus]|uniref:uncharacterized protein LOC111611382 isoform X1 n=1 Tax=Xiphophorus maculatus TaxID=8083 RepID=UPI000C6D3E31|nr:uncharacterized protein LOC111611382 isoform X1 [Xiphophorus maculatus]XP_023203639.1 uncharacterized protein LOC111611382 isoform X1 [Xiphophorus maculatus]XP_023203640.1 uncharacterized protein LOC111611382 isoform X1 [Xiphophorus maculatus]